MPSLSKSPETVATGLFKYQSANQTKKTEVSSPNNATAPTIELNNHILLNNVSFDGQVPCDKPLLENWDFSQAFFSTW